MMKLFHPTLINHCTLIDDKNRNLFFKQSLEKYSKDKIVLDMGSGTGILSFYALNAGAKFVYAVENDKNAANITKILLGANFDQSRFCVLNINFWEEDLSKHIKHKIDILVSETVGPGLFDQGMLRTWHCIKNYVSDNFISIPDRLCLDVYQWNSNFSPTKTSNFNSDDFSIENCLDDRIYNTLEKIDNYYNKFRDNNITWYEMPNNYLPDKIYENQLSYSFNDIVNGKSYEEIEFTIFPNYNEQKTFCIINKICFEDKIFYLKDGKCEFKFIPFFNVNECKSICFKFEQEEYNLFHLIYHRYKCWKISVKK